MSVWIGLRIDQLRRKYIRQFVCQQVYCNFGTISFRVGRTQFEVQTRIETLNRLYESALTFCKESGQWEPRTLHNKAKDGRFFKFRGPLGEVMKQKPS